MATVIKQGELSGVSQFKWYYVLTLDELSWFNSKQDKKNKNLHIGSLKISSILSIKVETIAMQREEMQDNVEGETSRICLTLVDGSKAYLRAEKILEQDAWISFLRLARVTVALIDTSQPKNSADFVLKVFNHFEVSDTLEKQKILASALREVKGPKTRQNVRWMHLKKAQKENQDNDKLEVVISPISSEVTLVAEHFKDFVRALLQCVLRVSNGVKTVTLTITCATKNPDTHHKNLSRFVSSNLYNSEWITVDPNERLSVVTIQYQILEKELVWKIYPLSPGNVAFSSTSGLYIRNEGPHKGQITNPSTFQQNWAGFTLSALLLEEFEISISKNKDYMSESLSAETHLTEYMLPTEIERNYNFGCYVRKCEKQLYSLVNSGYETKFIIGIHDSTCSWIGFVPTEDSQEGDLEKLFLTLKLGMFPPPCWHITTTIHYMWDSLPSNWGEVDYLMYTEDLNKVEILCALVFFKGIACWIPLENDLYQLIVPGYREDENWLGKDYMKPGSLLDGLNQEFREMKSRKVEDFTNSLSKRENFKMSDLPSLINVRERVVVEYTITETVKKSPFVGDITIPVAINENATYLTPFGVWLRVSASKLSMAITSLLLSPLHQTIVLRDNRFIVGLLAQIIQKNPENVVYTWNTDSLNFNPVVVFVFGDETAQMLQSYINECPKGITCHFLLLIPFKYLCDKLCLQKIKNLTLLCEVEVLMFSEHLISQQNDTFISHFSQVSSATIEKTEVECIEAFNDWTLSSTEIPQELVPQLVKRTIIPLLQKKIEQDIKKSCHVGLSVLPLYKPLAGCGATATVQIVQHLISCSTLCHPLRITAKFFLSIPTNEIDIQIKGECNRGNQKRLVIFVDDAEPTEYREIKKILNGIASKQSIPISLVVVVVGIGQAEFCISPFLDDEELDLFADFYKRIFTSSKDAICAVVKHAKEEPDYQFNRHLYVMALAASSGRYTPPRAWVKRIYDKLGSLKLLAKHLAFVLCFTSVSPFSASDRVSIQETVSNTNIAEEREAFNDLFHISKTLRCVHPFFAQILLMVAAPDLIKISKLDLEKLVTLLLNTLDYFFQIANKHLKCDLIFYLLLDKGDHTFSRLLNFMLTFPIQKTQITRTEQLDRCIFNISRNPKADTFAQKNLYDLQEQKPHLELVALRFKRSFFDLYYSSLTGDERGKILNKMEKDATLRMKQNLGYIFKQFYAVTVAFVEKQRGKKQKTALKHFQRLWDDLDTEQKKGLDKKIEKGELVNTVRTYYPYEESWKTRFKEFEKTKVSVTKIDIRLSSTYWIF